MQLAVQVKRALTERAIVSLVLLALGYLTFRGDLSGEHGMLLLVGLLLSLVLPGLGVAAFAFPMLMYAGNGHPLTLLLAAPVVVLAFRFWPQACAWLASVGLEDPLASYLATTALLFSLKFASPNAAAFLMFFYVLSAGFKLARSVPPGSAGCQRLVVARGLANLPESDWVELAGEWFFTNLIGPPRLLLLALTYAAAGAAASKLQRLEATRLAGVLPSLVIVLALNVVASTIGVKPGVEPLIVLAGALVMTLLAELRRVKLPSRRLAVRRAMRAPRTVLPHMEGAWTALCKMLAGGERLLLVFGPSGCGKTLLVRETLKACRLRVADRSRFKGKVVHLENAESEWNLDETIRKLLISGAKCVVLETSRPLTLLGRLKTVLPRKAVYVMPPDENARSRLISQELAGLADENTVAWLAEATQRYSLRGLMKLLESIKAHVQNGSELGQAIAVALQAVPPDLSYEELAECERFITTFKGMVAGFSRGQTNDGVVVQAVNPDALGALMGE
ncbi:MAG: hypothetical protein QXF05_03700 [Thermofilaceae archaeon]